MQAKAIGCRLLLTAVVVDVAVAVAVVETVLVAVAKVAVVVLATSEVAPILSIGPIIIIRRQVNKLLMYFLALNKGGFWLLFSVCLILAKDKCLHPLLSSSYG